MSSCGNPAVESDALMTRKPKYDKSRTCVRCKENTGNLVIRHAVYCKDCFFPLITHRFRRSLEPFVNPKPDGPRRTALKPTGDLLIGYSGGLGSAVLLDLVARCYVTPDKSLVTAEGGRDHPRKDRVWKKVRVCYVEVCDAFPGMPDRTEEIRMAVNKYQDLEFIPLRIQDSFDPKFWKSTGVSPDQLLQYSLDLGTEDLLIASTSTSSEPTAALRAYLAALPTPSALPTILKTLTRLLLLYTAYSTKSSHLVLGTSLTSLAVSLITSITQGGGFHVKEETQEEWRPTYSTGTNDFQPSELPIRIIRPLRDIGMKECGAWAWWMDVKVVGREKWVWPGAKSGIGSLTKDFIVGLEKDYPSTVSTIVRTCGKLAPKGEVDGRCILCERPIQEGIQEWHSRISIRSRADLTGKSESAPRSISRAQPSLTSLLCYTCHTTLTSRSSRSAPPLYPGLSVEKKVPLPVWIDARLSENSLHAGHNEVITGHFLTEGEKRDALKYYLLDD
ncbi:hypothetical protein C8Q75DRAFT_724720 [Abortiporus biennis]|nr:hypothetical protein C8Q75DRAFT_724720 [Abortiporus biennis]